MGVQIVCVLLLCVYCVNTVRVNTRLGELEGSSYITKSGRKILTFLGVPYAQPLVGKYKFEESRPALSWSGTRQAIDPSPACIQVFIHSDGPNNILGSEDCFYMNIYTPTISNSSNLPVLVFFHGGAFMFGQNNGYSPNFFHNKYDIVFAIVNYRLGPIGFLSTEDDIVPGNNGLKDQVLALKWIQENIAAFGGDRNRVTISGNSAGAASVHYHYLSPLSRGLFDKGILSSGSALVPWALTEEPLQKAKLLANAVGCPTNTTYIMMKCLKHTESRTILSKVKPLFIPWLSNPFSPFGPVIEKSTTNPFLSEHPFKLLTRGDVYDGPWLGNFNTEEGLYTGAEFIDREEYLKMLNNDWRRIAPYLLDFNYTAPYGERNRISNRIRTFYLGNKAIKKKTRNIVIEMVGDRLFKADIDLAVKLQASVTTSPVFFFVFGYRGSISLSDMFSRTKGNFGVSHLDDMYYTLSNASNTQLKTAEDKEMIKVMTGIWASFIKTGQPSLPRSTRWDPVSSNTIYTGQLQYLMIKSPYKMFMKQEKNMGNNKFWYSLKLNENYNYRDFN